MEVTVRKLKSSVFLVLIMFTTHAQDVSKKIQAVVEKYHKANPDLGLSVGFIHQNREYYMSYGTLNRMSKESITKNSVFEIGSITKAITGNLVAQAALEDKFGMDDYIDDYLPEVFILKPALRQKIKISDLASHQSGLPDVDFGALIAEDPQQPMRNVTKETLVSLINDANELIDYGNYRYSTLGFALLGQLLEKVYDKDYEAIFIEKINTILQLPSTYVKDFETQYPTTGYNSEGGEQEFFEWNIMAPAGLVKSSASDMVTYLKQILDTTSTLGKAALVAEQVYLSEDGRKIGLGIGIVEDEEQTLYLKSGDSMGQSSMLCYNRDKNWGIIILINQRNSKLRGELLNEIYETVLQ